MKEYNYNYNALVKEIFNRNIELCQSREEWRKIGFALSDLGEQGRELFHTLASMSNGYKARDTDKLFNDALKNNRNTHISTLIFEAKQRGIDTNKFYDNDETASNIIKLNIEQRELKPQKPVFFIPYQTFVVNSRSTNSVFCDWLFKLFEPLGKEKKLYIAKILFSYEIGATKDRYVIFWKIDQYYNVTSGKVMLYETNGHRSKKPYSVKDIHTNYLSLNKVFDREKFDRPKMCFFGEHLIHRAENENKTIAIVESEKTALLCAIVFPQYVWLATSSLSNFTFERGQVLRGRNVLVFPDINGYKEWTERAETLKGTCNRISVSNYLKNYLYDQNPETNTEEQIKFKQKAITDKIDISDLIINDLEIDYCEYYEKKKKKQSEFVNLLKFYPTLQILTEKLGLEIE